MIKIKFTNINFIAISNTSYLISNARFPGTHPKRSFVIGWGSLYYNYSKSKKDLNYIYRY